MTDTPKPPAEQQTEAVVAAPNVAAGEETRGKLMDTLKSDKTVIKIADIADALDLKPEKVKLPNGREIESIQWKPEQLGQVFELVEKLRAESGLGKNDVVAIDGVCPTWLLPTISHGWHPTSTGVKYPQGGPDAMLPLSGVEIKGEGAGENLGFKVEEKDGATVVEFSLTAPQIDAAKTVGSLVAPAVPEGKPVHITGRGPIAIAAALAEAYAHRVPYVANFQPGVGYVVSISHDEANPIGKVIGA